jgi:hypothetical protein
MSCTMLLEWRSLAHEILVLLPPIWAKVPGKIRERWRQKYASALCSKLA